MGMKKNRMARAKAKEKSLMAELLVTATLDGVPPPSGYFLGSTRFNFHFEALPHNWMCVNLHTEGPDFIEAGDTFVLRMFILASNEWRHLLVPGELFTLNAASTVHGHGRIDQVVDIRERDD